MSTRPTPTASMAPTRPFQVLDWGLLLLAGCIWGASFFFIAEALTAFPPMLITWLRLVFGFATLSCVPASHAPVERQDWKRIVVVAVVWMAFPLSMFPFAEQRVSSALTGMLNGATPIAAAVVATVLTRRVPGPKQRVGLVVGTAGIVLIGLPSVTEGSTSAFGVGLIMIAICSYGVAINAVVPLQRKYGSLPVLRRAAGTAAVLLAPFGLWSMRDARWDWSALGANLALGVFGSAVAFVAAGTLAGRVGPTRASTTTYIMPVVALFLGAVVRGEDIAVLSVVGSAVVLTGAYLANRAEG